MSRAEKFIREHTRNCSNEMEIPYLYSNPKNFYPWLTPDQARRAVEIAMEETIEKACYVIRHKYGHYHYLRGDITEELIKEFVKAMKDE
jgi:hypothetical protein